MLAISTSFKSPILSSRKDIWENFPVSLVQLGRDPNDGADRHAVVWNRKNIVKWRQNCPDPNSWYVYEKAMEASLLAELRRSTKWFVEPRHRDDQICVIRMAFKTENSRSFLSSKPYTENIPILTRLKDIQTFFPAVVWHEVAKKTYTIQLSCKKLQDNEIVDKHVTPAVISHNLYRALRASTAWTVLPSEGDEMCRIVIA